MCNFICVNITLTSCEIKVFQSRGLKSVPYFKMDTISYLLLPSLQKYVSKYYVASCGRKYIDCTTYKFLYKVKYFSYIVF